MFNAGLFLGKCGYLWNPHPTFEKNNQTFKKPPKSIKMKKGHKSFEKPAKIPHFFRKGG